MERTFIDVLKEMHGDQIKELTDEMLGLVEAVTTCGKGGKLTFTVTVKPFGKGDTKTLTVDPSIKVTKPVLPSETTIFYPNAEHMLQRNDPRQPSLLPPAKSDVRNFREARASNGE
jgi:hypothetical protein